jgi:hypothetical protein
MFLDGEYRPPVEAEPLLERLAAAIELARAPPWLEAP